MPYRDSIIRPHLNNKWRSTMTDPVNLPSFLTLPPLVPLLELSPQYCNRLRSMKARVGFTCGAFDLLHAGHLLMFQEARARACDFLIVGLQTDPSIDRPSKNPPVESLHERRIRLAANKYIDAYGVYSTEEELEEFLGRNARANGGFIDVRILDEEYRTKSYTGRDLPITPYYNWRGHPYSTTELRRRVAECESEKVSL
jgi:glycerol-3-phosphate cytidylyltransferase